MAGHGYHLEVFVSTAATMAAWKLRRPTDDSADLPALTMALQSACTASSMRAQTLRLFDKVWGELTHYKRPSLIAWLAH